MIVGFDFFELSVSSCSGARLFKTELFFDMSLKPDRYTQAPGLAPGDDYK